MKAMLAVMIALAFSCSSLALAQDEAAKKEKKEDHHHHAKTFSCDEPCGFSVKSSDEKEVGKMVQMHAKSGCACCQNLSEDDIKGMMKEGKKEEKEVNKTVKKEEKEMMKEGKHEESDPPTSEDDD